LDGIIKGKNVDIHQNMSFLDWSKSIFGEGITKYFMVPYNKKLWSYSLSKMSAV
jgi:protoporphyrinogen oxidase